MSGKGVCFPHSSLLGKHTDIDVYEIYSTIICKFIEYMIKLVYKCGYYL